MKIRAEFYLLFVAAAWGLTFPLIEEAVPHIDPVMFVSARFLLASLLIFPFIVKKIRETNIHLFFLSIAIGLFNFGAYTFQTMGLQTISSSESAFITGISVIFVPILAAFFRIDSTTRVDYVAALICLIGLYFITGAKITALGAGEGFTLLSALCIAITMILIQIVSRKEKQFLLITFYQIIATGLFGIPLIHVSSLEQLLNRHVVIAILFCAIVATALALFIQTKYQRLTTVNKAAVIFCAEPIFASLFAFYFFDESLSKNVLIGGSIILSGILLPILVNIVKRMG